MRALGFWGLDRGIAKMAISPLAKAATAATAKAGEFPPPNSWSHGPLPRDTTTCSQNTNKSWLKRLENYIKNQMTFYQSHFATEFLFLEYISSLRNLDIKFKTKYQKNNS